MARGAVFAVKIDVTELTAFGDKLSALTPEAIGALTVGAINEVADRTYVLARKTMLAGINLTDTYVQKKMQVQRATPAQPLASITAFGDKGNLTGLSHYGAISLGPKNGVSVEVITGARKTFERGFFLSGKADTEGNPLVFARKKDTKKIVSRRGPAVYMLFRKTADIIQDTVYGDLSRSIIEDATRQLEKELA